MKFRSDKNRIEKGEKNRTFVLAKANGGESLGKVKIRNRTKHVYTNEMEVRLRIVKCWCWGSIAY